MIGDNDMINDPDYWLWVLVDVKEFMYSDLFIWSMKITAVSDVYLAFSRFTFHT